MSNNKSGDNRYKEYQEPIYVWYAITQQMISIEERLLILLAYVDNIQKIPEDNILLSFWDTTISSVLESLILAYARLFDKSSTYNNENCSIAQLNSLIKNYKRISVNDKYMLQEKFDEFHNTNADIKSIIHDYRCKRCAHNDLEIIFSKCENDLSLDALCDLYSSILELIRLCGKYIFGAIDGKTSIYNERTKYGIVFESMIKQHTEE